MSDEGGCGAPTHPSLAHIAGAWGTCSCNLQSRRTRDRPGTTRLRLPALGTPFQSHVYPLRLIQNKSRGQPPVIEFDHFSERRVPKPQCNGLISFDTDIALELETIPTFSPGSIAALTSMLVTCRVAIWVSVGCPLELRARPNLRQ